MQSTTSNGYYYFHCRFLVSNLIVHTDFLLKIFEVAKAFAGVLSNSEAGNIFTFRPRKYEVILLFRLYYSAGQNPFVKMCNLR